MKLSGIDIYKFTRMWMLMHSSSKGLFLAKTSLRSKRFGINLESSFKELQVERKIISTSFQREYIHIPANDSTMHCISVNVPENWWCGQRFDYCILDRGLGCEQLIPFAKHFYQASYHFIYSCDLQDFISL